VAAWFKSRGLDWEARVEAVVTDLTQLRTHE